MTTSLSVPKAPPPKCSVFPEPPGWSLVDQPRGIVIPTCFAAVFLGLVKPAASVVPIDLLCAPGAKQLIKVNWAKYLVPKPSFVTNCCVILVISGAASPTSIGVLVNPTMAAHLMWLRSAWWTSVSVENGMTSHVTRNLISFAKWKQVSCEKNWLAVCPSLLGYHCHFKTKSHGLESCIEAYITEIVT